MRYLLKNYTTEESRRCATLEEALSKVNEIVHQPDHEWHVLDFQKGSTVAPSVRSGVGPIPAT